MNKKILIAALVGAVASFLAGWLVFGYLLEGYYKSNTIVYQGLMKEPPVLWAIFVSGLCWSLLLAIIFDKWANIRTFAGGLMVAGWISFLIALSFDLSLYSFFNLNTFSFLVVDVVIRSNKSTTH